MKAVIKIAAAVSTGLAIAAIYTLIRVWPFIIDETIYAAGFTEAGWARVAVGQSEKDVLASLGNPLEISPKYGSDSDSWWVYSVQAHPEANYDVRTIVMREGRVLSKEKSYWID